MFGINLRNVMWFFKAFYRIVEMLSIVAAESSSTVAVAGYVNYVRSRSSGHFPECPSKMLLEDLPGTL